MPQDAAASGAESDADSTAKGDNDQDAAASGDSDSQDDKDDKIEKIVAARVGQRLKTLNVKDLERKAREYDQLQESQKTELQKLQDRITAMETEKAGWETERKQDRIRTSTVRSAAKLGYADPDDAFRLIDSDSIEDDGSNVDKLLADLLKAKPYLASGRVSGSADGGTKGEPASSKLDMNTLLRAAAKG